jgi:hypothetical protein
MYGLTVRFERCPDGVEFVKPSLAPLFRYRTERRDFDRREFLNLENPVFLDFINATDHEHLREFFDRFGLMFPYLLLCPGIIPLDTALSYQSEFREYLELTKGDDRGAAIAALNKGLANDPHFNLQPLMHLAGPQAKPRLILHSTSMLNFMLMEVAMAVAHGARLATCERCSASFLTGPLTGRRAHAVYCSDRCRVAAMRARKAASS